MGRVKIVTALLRLPSSVNAPEADGTTPLMAAARHCWPLISPLIRWNADTTIEVNRKTAWDVAVECSPYILPPQELHPSGTDWPGFPEVGEVEVFFPDGNVDQSRISLPAKVPSTEASQTTSSVAATDLRTLSMVIGTSSDAATSVSVSVDPVPKAAAEMTETETREIIQARKRKAGRRRITL
eukprot:GEMP01051728.1.p1 GENE.GEMP01051728.1~~GEMP01051728.1.p1  ORF type:complete len:183 (+),score=31.46 GEMP01051728.1:601-1149(+)